MSAAAGRLVHPRSSRLSTCNVLRSRGPSCLVQTKLAFLVAFRTFSSSFPVPGPVVDTSQQQHFGWVAVGTAVHGCQPQQGKVYAEPVLMSATSTDLSSLLLCLSHSACWPCHPTPCRPCRNQAQPPSWQMPFLTRVLLSRPGLRPATTATLSQRLPA